MRRSRLLLVPLALVIIAVGAAGAIFILGSFKVSAPPNIQGAEPDKTRPTLTTERVLAGLDHPWDIGFLPSGTMLITERGGTVSKVSDNKKTVLVRPDDVVVVGEGGMLGLGVDPDFSTNNYIYVCFNSDKSGQNDVRVARFMLNNETDLSDRKDIVTGIPSSQSGRHSGCRIGFGPDKNLWVATGDAADETEPQNMDSLGGKILRVDREGQGVSGNVTNGDGRIFSSGHRNPQGLAFHDSPAEGSYGISVEHGPDKDDEINRLVPGNFGWAPGRGYNESVSMTDSVRFPGAVKSIWSSGESTVAVSGADFIKGEKWKSWQGWLAVAVLKGEHIRLLSITKDTAKDETQLFKGEYGRVRTVRLGPDQNLYLLTDNGTDDAIYRITPA